MVLARRRAWVFSKLLKETRTKEFFRKSQVIFPKVLEVVAVHFGHLTFFHSVISLLNVPIHFQFPFTPFQPRVRSTTEALPLLKFSALKYINNNNYITFLFSEEYGSLLAYTALIRLFPRALIAFPVSCWNFAEDQGVLSLYLQASSLLYYSYKVILYCRRFWCVWSSFVLFSFFRSKNKLSDGSF